MDVLDRLASLGGTSVDITVDGLTYYVLGYRESGEVDLYDYEENRIASCKFDHNSECTERLLRCIEGEWVASEPPTDLYWAHSGKTEHDMAVDVGTWLAATMEGY
jgi:hypothetical protein